MNVGDFDVGAELALTAAHPPPPPYSPTAEVRKLPSATSQAVDAAALTAAATIAAHQQRQQAPQKSNLASMSPPPTPVTPRPDTLTSMNLPSPPTSIKAAARRAPSMPREREATRVDLSVRRSKALSRLGLDDPVFLKMTQLEGLVSSLQSALTNQSVAIHDVHGQLTEINDVLHKMQHKPNPASPTGGRSAAAPSKAVPQVSEETVEPEQLMQDLRAVAANIAATGKIPGKKKKAPVAPLSIDAALASADQTDSTSAADTLAVAQPSADVMSGDEGEDDVFEDAEDDGDYLRLCSMLEQLITEANVAVDTPVTTLRRPNRASHAAIPDFAPQTETSKPTPSSEETTPETSSTAVASVKLERNASSLARRMRSNRKRSESGARIRPVSLIFREVDDVDTDIGTDVEDFVDAPEHQEKSASTVATRSVDGFTLTEDDVVDEAGLVDPATASSVDAVEVRFYCQVTRTGNAPQRHEMRRRLVLPLLTGANMTPNNLRQIITGSAMAGSSLTGTELATSNAHNIQVAAPSSRKSVVRRALGTVQLMYWLLLFTLGVLMLDAYLCELAGTQAVQVVDNIRPDEQRRRPRALLTDGTQDADRKNDGGSNEKARPTAAPIEYTGLKPVQSTDAADTMRTRARRNSF
ncbi:hypothetical protein THASP1DRAFT_30216 [Thamnocephalis sphaerospora]|uniref:Uncharacterized protein n=1 Tax=Thamnocephalis sphaerospora TaxID=78915 RepID=A0A4P9XPQ2_9FUNG|nr:hypothetical protein THASP1DRAFT_30216 [Thamnocephalis sphaerospora]|eukprot:RKP07978.1 hypothetical protein THASP1DRAFT_30216 [Thamnocephalis sphaerospora]